MNVNDLLLQVECYVGLRQAIGYTVHSEEKLLKDFVAFLVSGNAHGPIRAQTAVDWACTPSPGRGPAGQASRLKVVRGFLSHLRATLPETEVPGPGILAPIRRPTPYLYSASEIEALMNEASRLGPKDSLRPHTYRTLIGLLASSGLRVGEALRLKVVDVRLDAAPPHWHIMESKFRKSRFVPLHSTTAEKMDTYSKQRKLLLYDGLSDVFFVSEKGGRLTYRACWETFAGLPAARVPSTPKEWAHGERMLGGGFIKFFARRVLLFQAPVLWWPGPLRCIRGSSEYFRGRATRR